jgi:E3 ubiquitin-protein ligase UBR1
MVSSQALIFLRRCEVLLVARFGFVFEAEDSSKPLDVEYYSKFLGLPSLPSILSLDSINSNELNDVITKWADQFKNFGSQASIKMPRHPKPFNLAAFPDHYEDLYETAFRNVCPDCGRTPSNPAICLVCGDTILGCCGDHKIHLHFCSGDARSFLMIKVI